MCQIIQYEYLRCGHLERHQRERKCSLKRWGLAALMTPFTSDEMLGCPKYRFKRFSVKAPCDLCRARGMDFYGPVLPKSHGHRRKWHVNPAHLLLESEIQPDPPRRSAPPTRRHEGSSPERQALPARSQSQDYCPRRQAMHRKPVPSNEYSGQTHLPGNNNQNYSSPPYVASRPLPPLPSLLRSPERKALYPSQRADPYSVRLSADSITATILRQRTAASPQHGNEHVDILAPQPRRVAKFLQQPQDDGWTVRSRKHDKPSVSNAWEGTSYGGNDRISDVDMYAQLSKEEDHNQLKQTESLETHGGGAATRTFLDMVFTSPSSRRRIMPLEHSTRHSVHAKSRTRRPASHRDIDCNNCGHCEICRFKRREYPSSRHRSHEKSLDIKGKARSICGNCGQCQACDAYSRVEREIDDAEEFWNISLGLPQTASKQKHQAPIDSGEDPCERCKIRRAVVKTREPLPPRNLYTQWSSNAAPISLWLCDDCFDAYIEDQVKQEMPQPEDECWGCGQCLFCQSKRIEHEQRKADDERRRRERFR